MKRFTTATLLSTALLASALPSAPALAEGFVMGTGRWTCERARAAFITENASEQAQVAGWILGYWSAETFDKPMPFVKKVQEVGGQMIIELTLAECQKNPGTMLFQVSAAILNNSLKELTEEGAETPAAE